METKRKLEGRIERLVDWYGDGEDGTAPTREQWRRLLEWPQDQPITFVNFFKLRPIAVYEATSKAGQADKTGEQAFQDYAAVSIPTVDSVGGKFLFVGPFDSAYVGDPEDWDLVAVGSFPTVETFMSLAEHPDYVDCYVHRTAACARQRVAMCRGPST